MQNDLASLVGFIQNTISIPNDKAEAIANNFHPIEINKGDSFLKEGKVSNEYMFLERGFMRAYLFDTEGEEVTVNFYTAYSVVFECASFFQRVPSQKTYKRWLIVKVGR